MKLRHFTYKGDEPGPSDVHQQLKCHVLVIFPILGCNMLSKWIPHAHEQKCVALKFPVSVTSTLATRPMKQTARAGSGTLTGTEVSQPKFEFTGLFIIHAMPFDAKLAMKYSFGLWIEGNCLSLCTLGKWKEIDIVAEPSLQDMKNLSTPGSHHKSS